MHLILTSLCNKTGDYFNISKHFTSNNHREHFLRKHFPSVFNALSLADFKAFPHRYTNVLEDICYEIQRRRRRLMPYITTSEKFATELENIKEEIMKGEHFKEEPHSSLTIDLIMIITSMANKISDRKKRESPSKPTRVSSFSGNSPKSKSSSRYRHRSRSQPPHAHQSRKISPSPKR